MSVVLHYSSPQFIQAGTLVYFQAFNGGLGATPPGGTSLQLAGPSGEVHNITSFSSWSNFQVSFIWPAFTNSGSWSCSFKAGITSNALIVNAGTDAITISSVSSPVVPGGSCTITGSFPATQTTHYVQLDITDGLYGPLICTVDSWSASTITITIPSNAVGGIPPGQLQFVGIWTPGSFLFPATLHSSASLFIESNPSITTFTPTAGILSPSQSFDLAGFGFGFAQGSTTVTFNTVSGSPVTITPTFWGTIAPGGTGAGQQIIAFTVPAGADLGSDSVVFLNSPFTVTASLTVQTPLALPGGTAGTRNEPVAITGSGFGSSFGTLTYISVGGNPSSATPTDWSNTLVRSNVPGTADFGSGTFYVFIAGSTRENGIFGGFTIGTQASGPASTLFPAGALVTTIITSGPYPIHPPNVFPIGVVQSVGSGSNSYNVAWLNATGSDYTEINTPASAMTALGGLANNAQSVLGVYPPVVIGGG